MASFCSSCGGALGGSALFCAKCGARQSPDTGREPLPPPPPPAYYQRPAAMAPAPPVSGGSGIKILLIALLCLALLGLVTISGIYYAAHRVKQAVFAKADAYGVDLRSVESSGHGSSRKRPYQACSMLSKEQASRLI